MNPPTSKKIILRLAVPRNDVVGPSGFEQILASLHGLLSHKSSIKQDESISFEIVKIHGKVYFYIVAPTHLRTLITSQFYAQYSNLQIKEVKEYFTRSLIKDKDILVASLHTSEPAIFPIKRFTQFTDSTTGDFSDPLGPITSALAHLNSAKDTAIVQIIVSPIPTKWNEQAKKGLEKFSGSGVWEDKEFRKKWAALNLGVDQKLSFGQYLSKKWLDVKAAKSKKDAEGEDGKKEKTQNLDQTGKTSTKHDGESVYSAAYDKVSRLNFHVNLRVAYIHDDTQDLHAEAKMREIIGTFQQFALPQSNQLVVRKFSKANIQTPLFHHFIKRTHNKPFILSQEEVATLYHLPTESVKTSGIDWVLAQKLEPPVDVPTDAEGDVTLVAETDFRDVRSKYGIRPTDRRRHVYIIGKTGMGKSVLLENMIQSDMEAGRGVAVIDPHGDLADAVIQAVPKNRTNDVIIFDPSDRDFPLALNLLEGKNTKQRELIASGLLGVFKKIYGDSWGPRLEHILRNTLLALVEAPDTTMLGVMRMLVDDDYRGKVLHFVTNPMVQSFWQDEFAKMNPMKRSEAIGPIQNKVGQFLSDSVIRNIVGQPKSSLDIRFAMDTGKIVIINLSKGKIGEDNATLLGSMLITKFQLDAMSRADMKEADRRDFYLYVDEFQNFATDSFATILSEARKYKLSLTMANQYISQMSEDVSNAVFGNVGSLISFQVGINDAEVLSKQFDEEIVTPTSLANLPKYHVYNRIMMDGITSQAFSGATLPPPATLNDENPEERYQKVVNYSRQRYGRPRAAIEEKIMKWARPEKDKRKDRKEKEREKKGDKNTNLPAKTDQTTPDNKKPE